MSEPGLTQQISTTISKATLAQLSPRAVSIASRAIMDAIGNAHMGFEFVGEPFIKYAETVGGAAEATIIGTGRRVSAGLAAGINSTFSYNSNMMESGPGDHLLDALAHTAIAIGERVGASGPEIIAAVAVSYDLNAFFYKAARATDRNGFVNTKKHTPVCVASCAARVLRLDEADTHNAIGIAWMVEPPPMDLSIKLNVFTGLGSMFNLMICQLGIQAALLTQSGVRGPRDVIERDVLYDLEFLERFLRSGGYHVANELHLKPWLGSRTSTGAIQLVLELVAQHGIAVEDIDEVVVNAHRFYKEYPFNCPHPRGFFEGCYSVQWIIANALLGHEPGPDWVVATAFEDMRRQALAAKVRIGEHPGAVELWATGRALGNPEVPLEAVVRTKRGEFKKSMKYREILGSPDNPMSDGQLQEKFRRLTSRMIGSERAERLLVASRDLTGVADIRHVTALY
jgi:2-methylcitrate dehydratase PrpD